MTTKPKRLSKSNQKIAESMRLLKWERCECGHVFSSHAINMKKTMKGKYVMAECTKCKCKEFQAR